MQRLPYELLRLTLRQTPTSIRRSSSTLSTNTKHPYITTPIFYVNASPHIGHLHSTLLADVYARYHNLINEADGSGNGKKSVLCTGTDEHGLKIRRVALGLDKTEIELCDDVSQRFKSLAKAANIDYTIFMRTTEERHKIAVQHVWRELVKRGHIYKSSYSGWYAVSDEAYYPESQVHEVINPKTRTKEMVSIETGTTVEWMEEENYKFRLSAFREPLLKWLSATPSGTFLSLRSTKSTSDPILTIAVLQPPARAASLLTALSTPNCADLQDLSISRPSARLPWGIRVPDDETHTVYVWIDALVNYLTAAGYPWKGGEAYGEGQVWPPELMIVGKDIVRFHAIYLPCILIALSLPLPTNILAHGHWTMNKFKMSKSRGNVADPFGAMELWGTDTIRCFLMKVGGNSDNDANYSQEDISVFYKKDLMGTLGNLFSRAMNKKMLAKLERPELLWTRPSVEDMSQEGKELMESLGGLPAEFQDHMRTFQPHKALQSVFSLLSQSNRHITLLAPWHTDSPAHQTHESLFLTSECLRITAILLQLFMPSKMEELLDGLGVRKEMRGVGNLGVGEGGERGSVKSGILFKPVELPAEEETKE